MDVVENSGYDWNILLNDPLNDFAHKFHTLITNIKDKNISNTNLFHFEGSGFWVGFVVSIFYISTVLKF